jgi:hypothetical protein
MASPKLRLANSDHWFSSSKTGKFEVAVAITHPLLAPLATSYSRMTPKSMSVSIVALRHEPGDAYDEIWGVSSLSVASASSHLRFVPLLQRLQDGRLQRHASQRDLLILFGLGFSSCLLRLIFPPIVVKVDPGVDQEFVWS